MTYTGSRGLRVLELLLCTVAAAALSLTALGGFNVSDQVHGNVLLGVGVSLVCQAILLASAISPRAKVPCLAGYAVLAVVACVVAVAVSGQPNPVADVPQNGFATVAVFALVNAAVFLLSRKHVGCLVLLGAGAFLCGFIQFLYTWNMLLTTLVFLLDALALVALRAYAGTVADAGAVDAPPLPKKAALVGVGLPLVAVLGGLAVVIVLIMPLNPPHAELRLINEYVSYQEDRIKTAVEIDPSADRTMTSSVVGETLPPRTTTDKKEDTSATTSAAPEPNQQPKKDYLSGDYSDVDMSGAVSDAAAIALNPSIPWHLILPALLAALILLLTVPRYVVRALRLKRIKELPPLEQPRRLYEFFLSRFAKLGMAKPEGVSPVEYANINRERIEPFAGAQDECSFDHLTALFVRSAYANQPPTAQELECLYWLYGDFYRRARKKLGLFKYLFKYITL
ncbi:MAG: DUF4129 domain-containing protein [Coriobacteriia bacterium]|nr:DUF4129 domain-containing protein [Coriobacteriia bacterium]